MRGIIWYNTLERGMEMIEKIEKNYERYHYANLLAKTCGKHRCELIFDNGDHWKIVPSITSARGNACNISYIDHEIPSDVIHDIIKPCTKAGPYQAFKYF